MIHILDFCHFSMKAVNLPLIASFLHTFPCVICSNFLSAALTWQWLVYKCQVIINRFWWLKCLLTHFWCFKFIVKFRNTFFCPVFSVAQRRTKLWLSFFLPYSVFFLNFISFFFLNFGTINIWLHEQHYGY